MASNIWNESLVFLSAKVWHSSYPRAACTHVYHVGGNYIVVWKLGKCTCVIHDNISPLLWNLSPCMITTAKSCSAQIASIFEWSIKAQSRHVRSSPWVFFHGLSSRTWAFSRHVNHKAQRLTVRESQGSAPHGTWITRLSASNSLFQHQVTGIVKYDNRNRNITHGDTSSRRVAYFECQVPQVWHIAKFLDVVIVVVVVVVVCVCVCVCVHAFVRARVRLRRTMSEIEFDLR
jgi:hypothetical protein